MGQSKSTTQTTIPEWQQQFVTGTMMPQAQVVAGQQFQQYGGQFAPEMSQYSTQAGQTFGDIAGMDFNAATQANFDAMRQNVLDPQVQAMARRYAQEQTGHEAQQIGAGAFGSRGDVYQAERDAAYDANVANLMAQGYNAAQAATLAQAGARQAAAGGLLSTGQQATALGATQLGGEYQDFLRGQGFETGKLGALMGVGAGDYGRTTTESYKPGLFDYLTAGFSAFS